MYSTVDTYVLASTFRAAPRLGRSVKVNRRKPTVELKVTRLRLLGVRQDGDPLVSSADGSAVGGNETNL
jgi:hypothetical protein